MMKWTNEQHYDIALYEQSIKPSNLTVETNRRPEMHMFAMIYIEHVQEKEGKDKEDQTHNASKQ